MNRDRRLGISLGLNAVLGVMLLVFLARQPVADNSPADKTFIPDSFSPTHSPPPVPVLPTAGHPAAAADRQPWLEQLRAAGVADAILARVVACDFENRWEKRRREVLQQIARGDLDETAYAEFEAQHDPEQEAQLRLALGDEGYRAWDKENLLRDFDNGKIALSSTEADAVYQLKKDLARRQQELAQARRLGDMDEDDLNDRRAAADQEYHQQLKAALGDERYGAFNNPNREIEGALRHSLKSLNPTDTQLAAMLDAQRQWTGRRAEFERGLRDNPVPEGAYESQIAALSAARDEQYRQALGADAFAAFQQNQDNRYQMMKHYAAAWKLSDADINHLYGLLHDYDHSAREYKQRAQFVQEQGQPVDWESVRQNLREFSQQTIQTLRAYLGDDRYSQLAGHNVLELGN